MAVRPGHRGTNARSLAAPLAGGLALLLALAPLGCGVASAIGPSTCDRSESENTPVLYTQGTVEDGIYMTSDWDGQLLYFPGGMRYLIDHKLGDRPRSLQFFLSFDQYGTNTGVVSPASGNQVELKCISDTDMIVVNGSCVEYWLLVVASAGEEDGAPDDGAGGAGGGAPVKCADTVKTTEE